MIYEVHYLSFKYHIYTFLLAFSQSLLCHLIQHAFIWATYIQTTYGVTGFHNDGTQILKQNDGSLDW